MANDTFQKFKSSLNRGVATISVKTSSSLEKAKIKTHIEALEKEIEHLMIEIGNSAYGIWEKEEDYSVLNESFQMVKQKKTRIVQLNQEYDAINEKEEQILGSFVEDNNRNNKEDVVIGDAIVCPNCGISYVQSVNFCKKCGQKLVD